MMFLFACADVENIEVEPNQEENVSLSTDEKKYEDYVKNFQKVTAEELSTTDDDEFYFLYTGRKTCPYCVIFVPKLYYVSLLPDYKNLAIKYLESDNQYDTMAENFMDRNNIEYVPNFSYFEGDKIVETMAISDQTTAKEIQLFINNLTE